MKMAFLLLHTDILVVVVPYNMALVLFLMIDLAYKIKGEAKKYWRVITRVL